MQNVKTKSHDSITAFKDKTETIISAFSFHTSYYNQSAVKLSQCGKQRHAAKYASNIVKILEGNVARTSLLFQICCNCVRVSFKTIIY